MKVPDQALPRRLSLWRRSLLGLLRLFGWRPVLVWPPEPKGIIIVLPHTSNWDFIVALLFRIGYGLPANWIAKTEMFRWPFRRLLARLGGIPLDRRHTSGFVDALVQQFARRDWMWVGIAPEGTRSRTDHIKSGFYQLARAANVPVGLGYIDYGTRSVGIDTYVRFTGDEERDLDVLRRFYSTRKGRRPELAGEIRFRH